MGKYFVIRRFVENLIGASFSISIFFIIMISSSGFNLFEFHNLITTPAIWAIFFGYGFISSMIIDFIGKFIPDFSTGKKILLYILFGYLIFLILMPIEYLLIAGTVGAFFSLLFLLGKEKIKPSKWFSWMVFVVPLVCIVMIPLDHTSKVGWNEVTGDKFVEVEYEYFNGEHLIPVHGQQGEQIYFNIKHHFNNGNSYGTSLYDEHGNHVGMNEERNGVLSMEFKRETTKYIVVRAINGNQGNFQVTWWKKGETEPDWN
ncbi:hypothetical protein [Oceanobacillus sp. FSL H7-0719]|uniref:hypothetical protein n=1 Tax=Oceanobacillus sp. FSL H7-0719 TaxID=2954507 RepID=UPI003244E909